ncbi:cache domain-containing protein [Nocardioides sp. SYSU DS0663]|uniref:cache domain-containing protein n=1 Tax=Nocardioides sp. SYSU DS0663 TaxID=3416445 RepID=UPI003F4BB882
MPGSDPAATASAAVAKFFTDLGARLTASGDQLAAALGDAAPTSEQVLDATRPLALELLGDPRVLGAGFVAAPGFLADEPHLLAWWQGEDKELISASAALARSADYSRQEWFRTPQRTGRMHVTGPYIDYVCTDEFVLTTTVPVLRGGTLLGVMGADVLAETLESELLSAFRAARATLVNHHGRAVLSGDPRTFAGDPVDRASFSVSLPCDGLPLSVLA